MRMYLIVIASSLFFFAATAWTQPTPEVPSLSNSQVERLNNGEILVTGIEADVPTGDAIGVLDAPPATVIALINDYSRHSTYYDDIAVSEIQSTGDDYMLGRGVTDTPWPMEDREYVLNMTTYDIDMGGVPAHVSTYVYVPDSGNLVDVNGYYLCIPWGTEGTQTLLRYYIAVDLGTWIPDFLLEWSQENMLPGRIEGLRSQL